MQADPQLQKPDGTLAIHAELIVANQTVYPEDTDTVRCDSCTHILQYFPVTWSSF